MSEVVLSFRGRQIRETDLRFLRDLIAGHPELCRKELSLKVCEAWNWVQPNGYPRDMVCRSLMLLLHRAGHIQLPPPRRHAVNNAIRHRRVTPPRLVDTTPIEGSLGSLGPLEIRLVRRAQGEELFNHLLSQYHYLGFTRPVGEHLKYLVLAGERPLACLSWNSGPLKLKLRDQWVGAPWHAYAHHLQLIAYNSRYLIVPWVRVPQLASHLLGRLARRISRDWLGLYHHPIVLLESFVDSQRFTATCYRAANWKCLGRSQGRGTKSPSARREQTSIKQLWAYPLVENFRQQLTR